MIVRSLSRARVELSSLIRHALDGEEVIVTRRGKPVARLVPIFPPSPKKRPRTPGALAGQITIAQDFDRLPDPEARAFGLLD